MGFFLSLRGTTYHYRKAVPLDLRQYVKKREIKKTLRTGNKLEAQRKSVLFGLKLEQVINRSRAIAMSTELFESEKQDIINGLFNFILKIHDSHLDSAGDLPTDYDLDFPALREAAKAMGTDAQPDVERLRGIERIQLESSLSEHKSRDFQSLKNLVQGSVLFNNQELPENTLSGSFLNALSLARIEAFKLVYARSQGDNPAIPVQYVMDGKPVGPGPNVVDSRPSVLLTQVIKEFTSHKSGGSKWTEKTKAENLKLYQNFLDFAGDGVACSEISFQLVNDYREALRKLPSNRNKYRKYKNKTIHQVLKMDVKKTMSISTVNKNLNRLSTLLNFAVKLGYMTTNPAVGMEITIAEKDSEQRDAFSNSDLVKLFGSDDYYNDSFKHSFQFWMCPIALFTGMRLNEIAQLYLSDIYEVDSIWVIDINADSKDKKVKNKNAKRLVPMHPFLSTELNLPGYAKSLKAQGHKRLFPELEYQRDGYGQKMSRWFSRYKKNQGVVEASKVFHSFRHTIINHLKQKLVDDRLLHEFDGHAFKSETMSRYGKDYDHELIYSEIVSKITFDNEIDLDHLLKSKYVLRPQ